MIVKKVFSHYNGMARNLSFDVDKMKELLFNAGLEWPADEDFYHRILHLDFRSCLHNLDGPAFYGSASYTPNDFADYYIEGKKYSKEQWEVARQHYLFQRKLLGVINE